MQTDFRRDFLDLAADCGVLQFGSFELKSGRQSPYFFNLGAISSGLSMLRLARCFAAMIEQRDVQFDMLFGPAYKGIPLATAISIELARNKRDLPFAYNRKEAKDHGEGGLTAGAPLTGRVAVVDDVLTAGTAMRQALGIIREQGAQPAAALLAFDRMERGAGELSAVGELQRDEGITVHCLATLDDLAHWLEDRDPDMNRDILRYRDRYGVAVTDQLD